MDLEITPEPAAEERAALLAALRELEPADAPPDASAWRAAALADDDEA